MTKEEVIAHLEETNCKHFILYEIDQSEIEGVNVKQNRKAAMANLEDSDIDEIYRRTAYNIQKDINACAGFGEAIYDAVKERMATVLENYFKETIDD